jgi:hypothetical protein
MLTSKKENKMDLSITHEEYEEYLAQKETVSNTRVRPPDMNFFDALATVDLEATTEGRAIAEAIRNLK